MRIVRAAIVTVAAVAGWVILGPSSLVVNPVTRPLFDWLVSFGPACEGGPVPGGGFAQPGCILPLWVRLTFVALQLVGAILGALAAIRLTRGLAGSRRRPAIQS